jgi:hypothetical protein
MDPAIDYIREYLKAEYDARKTVFTDTNEDHQVAKLKAVNAFFIEGARTDITVPDDDEREDAEPQKERELFLVKEYQDGKLYCAIVGESHNQSKTTYHRAVFVQRQKSGFKVIGIANTCPTCAGSAILDGKPCPECKGNGVRTFVSRKKLELSSFGKPTSVKKLERPTHPRYQPDYDSYYSLSLGDQP